MVRRSEQAANAKARAQAASLKLTREAARGAGHVDASKQRAIDATKKKKAAVNIFEGLEEQGWCSTCQQCTDEIDKDAPADKPFKLKWVKTNPKFLKKIKRKVPAGWECYLCENTREHDLDDDVSQADVEAKLEADSEFKVTFGERRRARACQSKDFKGQPKLQVTHNVAEKRQNARMISWRAHSQSCGNSTR